VKKGKKKSNQLNQAALKSFGGGDYGEKEKERKTTQGVASPIKKILGEEFPFKRK